MKISALFSSAVFCIAALLLSTATVSAEQQIDPSWKKYKVVISFIDSEERLFVASDREFFVPFNTHIYNRGNQPIALSNLKVGNKIWLYLGNSKKGKSEVKRIETLK
jgi:hypothetical protein